MLRPNPQIKLAELIAKAFRNAVLKKVVATGLLEEFFKELGDRFTEAELEAAFKQREARTRECASAAAIASPAVRLVEALLCRALAVPTAAVSTFPRLLFHQGSGKVPTGVLVVPQSDRKLRSLENEVRRLMEAAGVGSQADWEVGTGVCFRINFSFLWNQKRMELKAEIEKIQKEFLFFDSELGRRGVPVGQHRGGKLRRLKEARRDQLSKLLSTFNAWAQPGGFWGIVEAGISAGGACTVDLDSLLRGAPLPWEAADRHAGPAPSRIADTSRLGGERGYAPLDIDNAGKEALGCALACSGPALLFFPRVANAEAGRWER